MAAPVFLVDPAQLVGRSRLLLDGREGRHAATVRRIRSGERVDVSDGAGRLAECVVRTLAKDRLELDIVEVHAVPRPQPRLVVVQAIPKGSRGELAVELMTEAGVDAIVPWSAARCIARWRADRGAKALSRWRSTARETAKQSRLAWLPEVREPASTDDVVALLRSVAAAFVLYDLSSAPLSGQRMPHTGEIALVIGPEGGITPEEIAAFEAVGATSARLGPTVLRTSTAGVAAASVVSSRTARWS